MAAPICDRLHFRGRAADQTFKACRRASYRISIRVDVRTPKYNRFLERDPDHEPRALNANVRVAPLSGGGHLAGVGGRDDAGAVVLPDRHAWHIDGYDRPVARRDRDHAGQLGLARARRSRWLASAARAAADLPAPG